VSENKACDGSPVLADESSLPEWVPGTPHDVIVITNGCCNPADIPLDERGVRVVNQLVEETGFDGKVRVIRSTDAVDGALPGPIVRDIQERIAKEIMEPPVVIVDGRIVSTYGVDESEVRAGFRHAEQ
jgi:hypothetical protein